MVRWSTNQFCTRFFLQEGKTKHLEKDQMCHFGCRITDSSTRGDDSSWKMSTWCLRLREKEQGKTKNWSQVMVPVDKLCNKFAKRLHLQKFWTAVRSILYWSWHFLAQDPILWTFDVLQSCRADNYLQFHKTLKKLKNEILLPQTGAQACTLQLLTLWRAQLDTSVGNFEPKAQLLSFTMLYKVTSRLRSNKRLPVTSFWDKNKVLKRTQSWLGTQFRE